MLDVILLFRFLTYRMKQRNGRVGEASMWGPTRLLYLIMSYQEVIGATPGAIEAGASRRGILKGARRHCLVTNRRIAVSRRCNTTTVAAIALALSH